VRIAIAAGESSGDTLGAGLIRALKAAAPAPAPAAPVPDTASLDRLASVPDTGSLDIFGIAGPAMRAAGCEAWYRSEALSVMGLAEVLRHLPRLLKLRREFAERLLAEPPDVFCGIDSPDFNLPLAKRLKSAGIRTVQYVSPQVWAWRQSRVVSIAQSVDEVLCLLPFETDFYAEHGVAARFVGHPLADEIPLQVDRAAARAALGFAPDRPWLALLPGSRPSEVSRLALPFAETAAWLAARVGKLGVAVAIAHEGLSDEWAARSAAVAPASEFACYVGRAREVMSAADVVLTASGTASLEAMLLGRPMVVAYRMSPFSFWLFSRMGIRKLPFYSLPNLLAGRELAAEYVQGEVRADVLGPALLRCFEAGADDERPALMRSLHESLRQGASAQAAAAVLALAAAGSSRA
jgi:lipid-A-disaccharide synthase